MDEGSITSITQNYYEGKTINEAIKIIMLEKKLSRIEAIKIIYSELDSKNYYLIDTNLPENYIHFFFTLYNINFWLTIMFVILTYCSIMFFPQLYPYLYLRYLLTLVLLLFLPGYLIIDTIIPTKLRKEILIKISLAVIVNFVLVSFIEYMLITTSYGFKESSILLSLLGVTLIISYINSTNKYLRRYFYE